MKHNFLLGTLLCGCLVSFVACDDIKEEDRLIPVEKPDKPDQPVTVEKKVLVQEFSGIMCSNCPAGARELHSLQESNPGRLVVVNLQPEGNTLTRPIGTFTLASAQAKVYADHYGVSALPTAVIDGTTTLADSRTWRGPIVSAITNATTPLSITLTTDYDEASRKLTVNYDTEFTEAYGNGASMLVWVIESGIIGPQIDTGNLVKDYEHNHIFRASANGNWGSSLGASFAKGDKKSGSATITLDQNWKAENCEVVAFVFNTATRATLQAETAHVVNK